MLRDINNRTGSGNLTEQNITGKNEEGRLANTPLRVLTASSIMDDKVKNYEGEDIGDIENLMINVHTGTIEYVVISFGGFLGIGEKLFAVPFKSLRLNAEEEYFSLDISEDVLDDLPGFDKDHWPQTNSEHWNEVNTYWNTYNRAA